MKAVLFGLESFCRDLRVKHIRVTSDNTTTVAYINAIGGIKSTVCNEMALQLWQWSCGRNIRLSACHLQAQATRLQTVGRGILMAPLNGPLTWEYLKILAVSGGLSKLTCLHLGWMIRSQPMYHQSLTRVQSMNAFHMIGRIYIFTVFYLSALHCACRRQTSTKQPVWSWFPCAKHNCGLQPSCVFW